jgi:uracil-DNA glycosylase
VSRELWPDDPATPDTPIARDARAVEELAAAAPDFRDLAARVSVCRACPRLVRWREQVATDRRRAYAEQLYWGRPLPGWGDERPGLLIVGLAPAAHGGNRTGRIFTGDRSGDWLFAALHRLGIAALPTSTHAGDGQRLRGTRIAAGVRCAPPGNKPTPAERDTCEPWLLREVELAAPTLRAVVALGQYAWRAALRSLEHLGCAVPLPRPAFAHAAEAALSCPGNGSRTPAGGSGRELLLVGSYHPSQQNTFTGRLTETMLDAALGRAAEHAGLR